MDITSQLTQLSQMSTEEKLRAIESIGDDLCHTSDFTSPGWHKDILEEREKRLKEGKEEILDWEESKQQLKDSLS
ncbi:addiction module protein [candidate division KSB1 bacterium]|nr:addiction module protein [candidate division KSB1 bacterium]